jgi:hypothetical protein
MEGEGAMRAFSVALTAWSVWMLIVVLLFIVQDRTRPAAGRS